MRFPRTPMIGKKVIVEGGIYHITQRAPGREVLFLENSDYLRLLFLVKKVKKDFKLSIICFSLLPNHLHLFLKIKELNLDKAMKSLFQAYAQYFNKKYQRKGHVFCGVYRASFCNRDDYLITASLYIHLNAYKAKLIESPFNYKWHSLDVYVKPIRSTFIDRELILNILNSNPENAKKIYRNLVEEARDIEYENVMENRYALKSFYEKALDRFKERTIDKLALFVPVFEVEEQIKKFANKARVFTIEDKNALRYLIEQLLSRGFSVSEIAKKLDYNRCHVYYLLANKTV